MIKLNKSAEPVILSSNKSAWTSAYMSYINAGQTPPDSVKNRYKEGGIKGALITETHGKCAYCESRVTHVYYGDVEHILPKDSNPNLIFEWNNLTFVCAKCNGNKHTYDNKALPLLNPYIDDPNDHFDGYGPCIFHRQGSSRGEITIKEIDLNRTELVDRRKDRLDNLNSLIDRWAVESDQNKKDFLKSLLFQEAEEDKEYSFIVKEYLSARGIVNA